jgi:hypothetical protein
VEVFFRGRQQRVTEIQGRKSDWKKWKDFGQRKSRKAQRINQSMDDGGEKQRWKTAKAEESTRTLCWKVDTWQYRWRLMDMKGRAFKYTCIRAPAHGSITG